MNKRVRFSILSYEAIFGEEIYTNSTFGEDLANANSAISLLRIGETPRQ